MGEVFNPDGKSKVSFEWEWGTLDIWEEYESIGIREDCMTISQKVGVSKKRISHINALI